MIADQERQKTLPRIKRIRRIGKEPNLHRRDAEAQRRTEKLTSIERDIGYDRRGNKPEYENP
jgi:hypothetical protein